MFPPDGDEDASASSASSTSPSSLEHTARDGRYRGTSLMSKCSPLGPYRRPMPRVPGVSYRGCSRRTEKRTRAPRQPRRPAPRRSSTLFERENLKRFEGFSPEDQGQNLAMAVPSSLDIGTWRSSDRWGTLTSPSSLEHTVHVFRCNSRTTSCRNVKRFRGAHVFKDDGLVHHSILGWRVIKNHQPLVAPAHCARHALWGYLTHEKPHPPPRTAIGAPAWSYCRDLRGGGFLSVRYPCKG
jgi:hypothetical protein